MKKVLVPIALGEKSVNVTLLHQVLKAMGFPAAAAEVSQGRAGQSTLKQLRSLQRLLEVPIDEATLIDQATAAAVSLALEERGLAATERSFTVTGTVTQADGRPRRRQLLLAFDIDLKAAAVYRSIQTLANLKKQPGFEFLGAARSDNLGNYRVTFYDWQYTETERQKADVVVFAVDGETITGRSRMVNSEDYSEKGLARRIDIVASPQRKGTEYEKLMAELNQFLKENRVKLSEIVESGDQLRFTAGELDIELPLIQVVAQATRLARDQNEELSHELLYGIGRQGIRLSWGALHKKKKEDLHRALVRSVEDGIIAPPSEEDVAAFLSRLEEGGARHLLRQRPDSDVAGNALKTMLSNALPQEKQRQAFVRAHNAFSGSDFNEFWRKHLPSQPEFKNKPELIGALLLTQQLTVLTGNHQPLVHQLQAKAASPLDLMTFSRDEWQDLVSKAGVPDFIRGEDDAQRAQRYIEVMQALLDSTFPTRRVALMLKGGQLGTESTRTERAIGKFLETNKDFDIAGSRISDFEGSIRETAGEDFEATRNELMKLQRVFQVSTSPDAMTVLLEKGLHSAYTIANIPRKSFIRTYSDSLGGEKTAFAIHERASHIALKSEMAAMHLMEYSAHAAPGYALGPDEASEALTVIENHVANYSNLFGRPDICECEHCRSVYGAAAYLVDLLRFLWRGVPNDHGESPLDILQTRRPDLVHLPLTCENTNTLIPYVDLANEVMEYFTATGSLTNFEGHDTGEAVEEELRANPQNFNLEAYRTLKDARYPFILPYHQPLDVIRTYSRRLSITRYEVLKALNPDPDAPTKRAIEAESLELSQEEYLILTGEAFDGSPDAASAHEYFGYATEGALESASHVPELLQRTGVSYLELVELVKTRFLNPQQSRLDFLQRILAHASEAPGVVYGKLEQVEGGTLDSGSDPALAAALTAYNHSEGAAITPAEFNQWVADHLAEFRQVITLYEPESKCALDNTQLKTIGSIYGGSPASGLSADTWSRLHRFIRLWRKLGWSIHETDLMLAALGEPDIGTTTIGKLGTVHLLKSASKQQLSQLAVLWGNIDTYGDKSLYSKLFLNKAVQKIDDAFKADAWGHYLQSTTEVLADHQSAILAAFRITEKDLEAILQVARLIDAGTPRFINLTIDLLNLQNLSTLYRYVVLAKALKLKVTDLCGLLKLLDASPFSVWDIQLQEFVDVDPEDTWDFYELADSIKQAGFKPSVLEYILAGVLPPDSKIGLSASKIQQSVRSVRSAFAGIEREHPEPPPLPLTTNSVAAKLGLTFASEVVGLFTKILDGTASFETTTDDNLSVVIPEGLAGKFTYVKGSGRLLCAGVMSDSEQTDLKALPGVTADFQSAVDTLYAAPDEFISKHFAGVFASLAEAQAVLTNHPAQPSPASLDEKLSYVYQHFIPILKSKQRRDSVTQQIGSLIGLTAEAAAILLNDTIETLIEDLSTEGFSAAYFSDASWTTTALERTDAAIDFDWGAAAPHPAAPSDNFSVRWRAFLSAPASGEYTLIVQVEEADESFNLYLDGSLILTKPAALTNTSLEVVVELNASVLHELTIEYAETSQNAGIRLFWKTATSALDILPSSAVYPAAIVGAFAARAQLLHRAAEFILGFELSEAEVKHFVAHGADFDNLDFEALTAIHWKRMRAYTKLRNTVPQAQAFLTDVFALANATAPPPTLEALRQTLHLATAWDDTSLQFLVDTQFSLTAGDFKSEISLLQLAEAMRLITRTGLSAQTLSTWGAPATDFDVLHDTAQLIKNTVKAKHEEADWLELAAGVSDEIRKNQQNALVAYLLTRPSVQAWGATDADGLFEYLLIDVQMSPCMETSRIVQANAAVQMFVNRILLNLESDTSDGTERGVSAGSVDKDRWEWMRNYRVWEANRKVFLYPENWLEPEWRNNRSEFFRGLESYLVQNDITDRSVEEAFRNYLTNLNEVANLEVCGLCRESVKGGSGFRLHVFARTHNGPYKFFYRRWDQYQTWSAWESIPVDVRCVERGDHSGVHLIPVVWKGRLFLFWPEFLEVKEKAEDCNRSVEDLAGDSVAALEPILHWEVRLAWSEYVDGTWTPKRVTKEFIKQEHPWYLPDESAMRFAVDFESGNRLRIYLVTETTDPREWYLEGHFELADITSKVEAESDGSGWAHEDWEQLYKTSYMNVAGYGQLELLGETCLYENVSHKLLLTPTVENFSPSFQTPFFFSDIYRTYFVRPVNTKVGPWLRAPESHPPFMTEIYEFDRRLDDVLSMDQPGGIFISSSESSPIATGEASVAVAEGGEMIAMSASSNYGIGSVEDSFAGIFGPMFHFGVASKRGLEFHTFYHPFSNDYVSHLNQDGLSGLMEADTTIPSDNGATFEDTYKPALLTGLVKKPADFAQHTYYKENVCFDIWGANSLYNWELFFHAPLYIATRLSRNGKYDEAMRWFHYIFDPTTDELPAAGELPTARYWKVLPFKTEPAADLEDWFKSLAPNNNPHVENTIIAKWRNSPFDPHLVASNRPLAYMKHVVLKYVENLMAWADFNFRQFTRESVYDALQLYVICSHVLGPRPEFVPRRGDIAAESFHSLQGKWDDFSNALVELENIFPYSSDVSTGSTSTGTSLLGVGPALYFCIPENEKLMEYWDTVADRLFKIRHCQDIDGVERELALFAPPIDPAALIQATSQGLSLGSILADLSSPPPNYRFGYLLQKANEFCADVKQLGSALLDAIEKKDAEELSRLRTSHETHMLSLLTEVRERRVLEIKATREGLLKARETASFRLQHYLGLLGETVSVPAEPTVSASLTAQSQLPADTSITTVQSDVDGSLVEADAAGVKLIPKEKEELDKSGEAMFWQKLATDAEGLAGLMNFIPSFSGEFEPLGVGSSISFGGSNIAGGMSGLAKGLQIEASKRTHEAVLAGKMAGYIRREQDWTLQANLAAREIIQTDKQITSSDIQIQIAEKELEQHRQAIEHAGEIELFLKDKFTCQELYQWMKEQLFSVYRQSYNLAFEMAKRAEKACKYELGQETPSVIQYGNWESSKQGLAAGEKLQLSLRQIEKSYLEENRRELELRKSISLALLDPLALLQLRETGKCHVTLPEQLFDLDFQGHYFRRIKSVSLTIPCVAGPYTSINCSLRLLSNAMRINTSMNSAGDYEHENDEGLWTDDDRFRSSNVPVTAMATSTGRDDPGLFEFSFRDERYLPFEGAGAISHWQIELTEDAELRQFDYSTISDVILHVSYTARDSGGLFKEKAVAHIKDFLTNMAELAQQPLMRMFSIRHEFPGEWHRFFHPAAEGGEQVLRLAVGKNRFPFLTQDRTIVVMRMDVLTKCAQAGDYHLVFSMTDFSEEILTSTQISMPENASFGGLKRASVEVNDAGLNLEELDIDGEISLKLKHGASPDFTDLVKDPPEVEDLFLVFHYKLD